MVGKYVIIDDPIMKYDVYVSEKNIPYYICHLSSSSFGFLDKVRFNHKKITIKYLINDFIQMKRDRTVEFNEDNTVIKLGVVSYPILAIYDLDFDGFLV